MNLLKRQYGTKRVNANMVYQEYIHDRDHIHMNSTQWETLTDFVKWLGREGLCVVDQTEKGWFVTYIDRDWEAIQKSNEQSKKEKMDLNDDERTQRFIEKQIERAQKNAGDGESLPKATDLLRSEDDTEKVTFNLSTKTSSSSTLTKQASALSKLDKAKAGTSSSSSSSSSGSSQKRKANALEEIMKVTTASIQET